MTSTTYKTSPVVLGGVSDFNALSQGSEFALAISTGRLALYTHASAVLGSTAPTLTNVGNAWKSTSGGVAEFGLFYDGFFSHEYQDFWVANGLAVTQANVDVSAASSIDFAGLLPTNLTSANFHIG